jgi:LmbE family N-acetylglucosaminyl deacetylase
MSEPLRLLAVLAHPDDESLGAGGSFARCAAEGVETHLVTATRGDRGRFHGIPCGDPGHPGGEELARLREGELRAACAVLGIRTLALLGYGDGVLDQADPVGAAERIAAHVRRVRPQVVVTFGPDGAYGHPDHIAVSQLTAAAVVIAADPARELPAEAGERISADGGLPGAGAGRPGSFAVSKLYYMASPPAAWEAYQEAFKKLVSNVDGIERQAVPWPEWEITTWVDTRAHWESVWRAVSCHQSQIGAYERLAHLSPGHHEALWGWQTFYRVFSTVNGGRERESDLFAGLR